MTLIVCLIQELMTGQQQQQEDVFYCAGDQDAEAIAPMFALVSFQETINSESTATHSCYHPVWVSYWCWS